MCKEEEGRGGQQKRKTVQKINDRLMARSLGKLAHENGGMSANWELKKSKEVKIKECIFKGTGQKH